jgi:predicted nucleotidyltransferase
MSLNQELLCRLKLSSRRAYNQGMQKVLADFTTRLKDIFGSDLLSVVLYGSFVRDDYRRGVSDINVLVILEKSDPRKIFAAGRRTRPLIRKYRITPLIMTREEFLCAADVFPLEYSDIQDAHRILYGDGEVLKPGLRRANLRYQLEEKLRGAVGDIRGMLLAAAGNEKILGRLLPRWAGVGAVLFRGLLRLKGIGDIPRDSEELLLRVSKEYGVSVEGFSALRRFRQGQKSPPLPLAGTLLETLKALVRTVDAMDGEPQ